MTDPAAPTPPRAVFFDVGDTLLDTSAMLDSAIFTALVPLDPTRTIADVRAAVARSAADMPSRLPPFHEARANAEWWIARYRAVGESLGLTGAMLDDFLATVVSGHFGGDALHVVADAPAALARLAARGMVLGVISNWDDTLESILENKGLLRFFAFVLASGVTGDPKPSRRIFERALARAGVRAAEAWHVGDDPRADAVGAQRAGLHALLLDPHDLHARLDGAGIVRARNLSGAVDRILGEPA